MRLRNPRKALKTKKREKEREMARVGERERVKWRKKGEKEGVFEIYGLLLSGVKTLKTSQPSKIVLSFYLLAIFLSVFQNYLSIALPTSIKIPHKTRVYVCRVVGDIGLFITLVPKCYSNVFLFDGLTALGKLLIFDWLVQ